MFDFRNDLNILIFFYIVISLSIWYSKPKYMFQDNKMKSFGIYDHVSSIFNLDTMQIAQFLNGIGIDRMVPLGSALSFDEVWDGEDFLAEFTRIVTIR